MGTSSRMREAQGLSGCLQQEGMPSLPHGGILNMGLFFRTTLGLSVQKHPTQRSLTGVFCIR